MGPDQYILHYTHLYLHTSLSKISHIPGEINEQAITAGFTLCNINVCIYELLTYNGNLMCFDLLP